jgi:tRNA uridine 5-carbamoylmethylation protein Kti12
MTLIVNLFGQPSAGKSTCAAALFALLKYRRIRAELVTEYAKDMVWSERLPEMADQLYLMAKQNHRFWTLIGKVDVIITDSPLLLNIHYNHGKSERLDALTLDEHEKQNSLNVFLNKDRPYDPVGRFQTEDEAAQIADDLKDMLDGYGVEYVELPGNEFTPARLVEMVEEALSTTQS